jgi:hypothetical protein
MRTGSSLRAVFKGRHRAEFGWFDALASLPGLSVSADRAVRTIVRAIDHPRPEVFVGLPARAATLAHGVAPGLTIRTMSLAGRLLPRPGGVGTGRRTGAQSRSAFSETFLTSLGRRAARRYQSTGDTEGEVA